jgi:hypothetical protein
MGSGATASARRPGAIGGAVWLRLRSKATTRRRPHAAAVRAETAGRRAAAARVREAAGLGHVARPPFIGAGARPGRVAHATPRQRPGGAGQDSHAWS